MHVVIIGNGIGGNAVAEGIRVYDRETKITIVTAENCPEYDPGSLPYYIGGNVPRDTVFLKKMEDYRRDGVELCVGKAVKVDAGAKKVFLEDGREVTYDKLVFATGGNQIIPPIKGVDKKGVFCCKVLSDADALANHEGSSAVVIGSGLIGIEACEALKKKGYEVTLIELMGWIMPRVFDEYTAGLLAESLVKNGINVLTGEKLVSIDGNGRVEGVTTDKRTIKCDTVVLATGVVPANTMAKEAGAEIGPTRGIKVNERLLTTIEDVYACGDCAESFDAVTGEPALYQLRHNALEQGAVIARDCVGLPAVYRGAWSFTRAHYFHTHAVSIGKTLASLKDQAGVELIERKIGDDYYRLIIKDGRLAGAQAIGRFADKMGILLGAIWRQDDLSKIRSNWQAVSSIISPYPWYYRVIGRYMQLS